MKKRLLAAALAAGLCLTLAGCSTSLADNTGIYFSEMAEKFELLGNSSQIDASGTESETPTDTVDAGRTALAAPANWSVDESGNYTFDAVDGASYYIIYMYDTLSDSTSYAYMSPNVNDDGSSTYSGALSDLFDYCYGLYDAEVVA